MIIIRSTTTVRTSPLHCDVIPFHSILLHYHTTAVRLGFAPNTFIYFCQVPNEAYHRTWPICLIARRKSKSNIGLGKGIFWGELFQLIENKHWYEMRLNDMTILECFCRLIGSTTPTLLWRPQTTKSTRWFSQTTGFSSQDQPCTSYLGNFSNHVNFKTHLTSSVFVVKTSKTRFYKLPAARFTV